MRQAGDFAAPYEALDETGFVERRLRVGRTGQRGDTTGCGGGQFRFGVAETGRKVDQSGRDDAGVCVDRAGRAKAGRRLAEGNDAAVGDVNVGLPVDVVARIDDAAVGNTDQSIVHAWFPARRLMTAMRTAMPKLTWERMTACLPSATSEAISTPRFIGPGCMTMASGLARASMAGVSP